MDFKYRWFCDTRRTNPTMFDAETIRSVQYIEDLANLSRVNLDTWDLKSFTEPVGASPYGVGIKLDKNKLNEAFFNEVERRAKDPSIPKEATKKLPTADFEAFRLKTIEKTYADMKRQGDECLYAAQDHARNAEQKNAQAIGYYTKADALIGRVTDITTRMNEVLTKGNWSYHSFSGSQICFIPTADIWLQYKNVETQEHYRVNFGQLLVKVDPINAQVRVSPDVKGKSPISERHYHPHVASDGNVCWGEGAAQYQMHMANANYAGLMQTLWTILNQYNPRSPYRSLAEFQKAQPDNKPGYIPNLCKKCNGNLDLGRCACCSMCENKPDDCDCKYCPVCDNKYLKNGVSDCDCCLNCNKRPDDCCCCRSCGDKRPMQVQLDGHWGRECGCCIDCDHKAGECTCEKCEIVGCGKPVHRCTACRRCKKAHASPDGYCPRCNRNEWKREMERRGVNPTEELVRLGIEVRDGQRPQEEGADLQPPGGPQASLAAEPEDEEEEREHEPEEIDF